MMPGFTENNEVKRGFGANSFGGFRTGGFGFGFSEDALEERKREKIESGGFEPVSGGFGGSVGFGSGKGPMGFSGSKGFGGSSGIGGLFGFGADQPEEEEKFPRFGGGFYDDTNAFGSFRDNNSEDDSDFESEKGEEVDVEVEGGGFEPAQGGFSGSVGFGFGSGPVGFSGSKGFGGSSGIGGLFGFGANQPVEDEDDFYDGFIVSGQNSDSNGFRSGFGFGLDRDAGGDDSPFFKGKGFGKQYEENYGDERSINGKAPIQNFGGGFTNGHVFGKGPTLAV